MRPELNAGRNVVEFELPPGHTHHTAWLDPELPATFQVVEEVLAGVAAIFRGPYIHIGGDEGARAVLAMRISCVPGDPDGRKGLLRVHVPHGGRHFSEIERRKEAHSTRFGTSVGVPSAA